MVSVYSNKTSTKKKSFKNVTNEFLKYLIKFVCFVSILNKNSNTIYIK